MRPTIGQPLFTVKHGGGRTAYIVCDLCPEPNSVGEWPGRIDKLGDHLRAVHQRTTKFPSRADDPTPSDPVPSDSTEERLRIIEERLAVVEPTLTTFGGRCTDLERRVSQLADIRWLSQWDTSDREWRNIIDQRITELEKEDSSEKTLLARLQALLTKLGEV